MKNVIKYIEFMKEVFPIISEFLDADISCKLLFKSNLLSKEEQSNFLDFLISIKPLETRIWTEHLLSWIGEVTSISEDEIMESLCTFFLEYLKKERDRRRV